MMGGSKSSDDEDDDIIGEIEHLEDRFSIKLPVKILLKSRTSNKRPSNNILVAFMDTWQGMYTNVVITKEMYIYKVEE